MAYKFNPFTGNFDITSTSSGGSSTDHQSGWKKILEGETVTVVENKQMVVFGPFENDGDLQLDGELILEE